MDSGGLGPVKGDERDLLNISEITSNVGKIKLLKSPPVLDMTGYEGTLDGHNITKNPIGPVKKTTHVSSKIPKISMI